MSFGLEQIKGSQNMTENQLRIIIWIISLSSQEKLVSYILIKSKEFPFVQESDWLIIKTGTGDATGTMKSRKV